jgi:hypothetical protein
MDGTIADLYGTENWLEKLRASDASPYIKAKPCINMQSLARILNRLQRQGYEIGIISWLAKNSTHEYNENVTTVKKAWLKKHLKSVNFNFITITEYGTNKNIVNTSINDILFDDDINNRIAWNGIAYDEKNIINILKTC